MGPIVGTLRIGGMMGGLIGFSAYQKISAVMRVIAYGVRADYTDEYLRIGKDKTIKSVRMFANVIIHIFGRVYVRAPNEEDIVRLMAANEAQGWSGMLDSIDYVNWTWKTGPRHGTGSIVTRVVIQQLCLRLLHLRICGFGFGFSVFRAHSMTSMYCIGLIYLRG